MFVLLILCPLLYFAKSYTRRNTSFKGAFLIQKSQEAVFTLSTGLLYFIFFFPVFFFYSNTGHMVHPNLFEECIYKYSTDA